MKLLFVCFILFVTLSIERLDAWSFGGSGGSTENNENSKKVSNQMKSHYKNRELQLEDLLSQGEEKCLNKPCVQSEQCCPGSVCVDTTHPNGKRQVTGTCLPIYGVNEGDNCKNDDDCEPGLRCLSNGGNNNQVGDDHDTSMLMASINEDRSNGNRNGRNGNMRTCQPPGQEMMKKQYNGECTVSSECDSSHGLCCQLIKRHRMAPRRACLYFSDPKICLGPVDVTFARPMAYSSYYYTPNEHEYFRARIG
ncbi:hypothetical protein RDWZM_002253 [Blomia tropicalis]|uniref:Prohormone-3 n=1 Tax=Blomia tropicalis TaxID=40697 RepID=A0A9Q0MES9_BLOTA|nr:hypothetical protein RDWZM_002253 [Blomia tropicalis]